MSIFVIDKYNTLHLHRMAEVNGPPWVSLIVKSGTSGRIGIVINGKGRHRLTVSTALYRVLPHCHVLHLLCIHACIQLL